MFFTGLMVKIFSKPQCVQCAMTQRTLDRQGVSYEVVDVSKDAAAAEQLQAWGYRQVPVVQVGEEHWSGFRPERLASIAANA
jgi:glutaredoxin-like protein NrdH